MQIVTIFSVGASQLTALINVASESPFLISRAYSHVYKFKLSRAKYQIELQVAWVTELTSLHCTNKIYVERR